MKFLFLIFIFIFGTQDCLAKSKKTAAKASAKKTEFLLRADQVSHEKDLGVIIARGKVKVSDGVEIIEADTVTYNQKINLVSASGHVKFYDKKGGVSTGNYLEFSEDFKEGFIEKVYLLTEDNQRFAANTVTTKNNISTFRKATYSPCEVCKKNPRKSPIWQLRASTINQDDTKKVVSYRNVFFDFKGFPVFYFPYFSHPDPSVKRKNGFLMPFFGNSTSLGTILGLPYYFSRNPSEEVVLRPIVITKESPMFSASYSRLYKNASLSVSGSAINTQSASSTNKKKINGHVLGEGGLDLNSKWRLSSKVERVSSPTYFKKYYFIEPAYRTKNYLDSSVKAEGFYSQNYLSIEGLDFQNLRPDVQNSTTPFVAPIVTGSYLTRPGSQGEFWSIDLNQAYVDRDRGAKVERLSTTGTFSFPRIFSNGFVQDFKAFLRGDFYDVKKHQVSGSSTKVSHSMGRFIPGLSWTLKYPLIREFQNKRLVVEPIVGAVVLPRGLNDLKFPDEDSQEFEFDAIHLMQAQRFSGFDKIDDGQRLNYGINFNLYSHNKALLQLFGGQSYSFSKTDNFDPFSGVQKGFSDYVGRLTFSPLEGYRAAWSFRLGQKSLKPKKNTLSLSGGPSFLNIGATYTQTHRSFFEGRYVRREQLSTSASSKFHENWTFFINQAREFGYKKGELQHGAGLLYQDDCFKVKFHAFRTFYKDRDVAPSKTFMLTIGLKNLGEYSTGSLSMDQVSNPIPQNQP
ncbi:LPS assembly protein LptD [Alphaproteobacteria bacterium]|nr:LPS assembly protein LptD [Alphaproteobacteria bacterium]